VIALLDLVGQIDTLIPSSSWNKIVFCFKGNKILNRF
jgi:hypothetical protein